MKSARGEHNPTATFGFEPVSEDAPALREAITGLSSAERSELYALIRVGQGQFAARQWHSGIVETMTLGDETTTALLIEDPDLHDHLVKGLYELALAS